jgi:hypothetical protein
MAELTPQFGLASATLSNVDWQKRNDLALTCQQ